jgi:DNA repair protein RadA/Sms
VYLLTETCVPDILEQAELLKPDALILDSVQTMLMPDVTSAPGSVAQVRACASEMARLSKTSGCAVFLIGHVTKEGAIAGPRVLEHMVDAVLYFEGERRQSYRVLRAVKNRFGSTHEIGLFEMTERGIEQVANPSDLFLSDQARGASGSAVFCALEGTRPMLVDIQALVARSPLTNPRRTIDGLDAGRVALLLAVLEKRAGLRLYDQDVFVNVAGGLSISEPAVDLALSVAVASSLRNAPMPERLAVFGEIGLSGEVRGVSQTERRLAECARLGYTRALAPQSSLRGARIPESMDARGVSTLAEALVVLQSTDWV